MANPDAQVAHNLTTAMEAEGMQEHDVANGSGLAGHTAAPGGAEHVASPTALGFNDTGWVGIAALVVLIGMVVWKVPAAIGAMLDKRIGEIRHQLDEAKQLRAEAEALREEYVAKARAAETDAAKMRSVAHHEAAEIVAKAKADTEALMDRRARMAEEKIAAAERTALAEVRARTAEAAAAAAATIIAERHDAGADRALVDRAIAGVGRLN
jgi:F-type H+-transporting ATPase subunit b